MRLLIFVCCILAGLVSGFSALLFAIDERPFESFMMLIILFAMMYTAKKLEADKYY